MTAFLSRSLSLSCLAVLLTLLCAGQSSQTFHAHLNKDMYLPGETIWFNAYVFEKSMPAEKSTTIFAGLYDAGGKLIQSKRFPLFNGVAAGSFDIPDSISSGLLYLNLFTGNIPEQNRSKAYNKMIALYQGKDERFFQNIPQQEKIIIEAVSEGGSLIAGLPNQLIFKTTYENGQPVSLAFAVKNNLGNLIDSVYSDQSGLAGIQIIPKPGERYTVNWLDKNGRYEQILLMESLAAGATLHSEIANKKLYYNIQKNTPADQMQELKLFLVNADDTLLSQQLSFKTGNQYVGNISVDSFPKGISVLRLEDINGKILQQKNIYINEASIQPSVVVKSKSTDKKGKNIIEVSLPGNAFSFLSASVTDAAFYVPELNSSIVDELLLNRSQSGLSLFETNNRLSDYFVNAYPPLNQNNTDSVNEDFLAVSVRNNSNNTPARAELDLIVSDKGFGKQFLKIKQAKPDIFTARGLIFYDSAKLYYQIAGNQNLSGNLSLQQDPLPSGPGYIQPTQITPIQFSMGNSIVQSNSPAEYSLKKTEKFNAAQTIQNVVIRSRYINPVTKRVMQLDDEYTTGMFKGMARGIQLNVIDDPYAQNSDPFNYILYKTAGVKVVGTYGSRVIMSNRPNDPGPLLLFIDENPAEFIQLESVQMSRVAYIKVILGIVITSSGTTEQGVIYVYSKRGNEDKSPAMKSSILKGYDLVTDYKMPDYNNKESMQQADYRSSLYWDPYITADKNNRNFTIEYYNNDISKKQILVIKGFNEYGQLIEFKKILE